jgi:hypothetical protein
MSLKSWMFELHHVSFVFMKSFSKIFKFKFRAEG